MYSFVIFFIYPFTEDTRFHLRLKRKKIHSFPCRGLFANYIYSLYICILFAKMQRFGNSAQSLCIDILSGYQLFFINCAFLHFSYDEKGNIPLPDPTHPEKIGELFLLAIKITNRLSAGTSSFIPPFTFVSSSEFLSKERKNISGVSTHCLQKLFFSQFIP